MEKEKRAFLGIWIPAPVWLDRGITLIEKIFLVEINSLDNEDGCYAGNKYFSEFFGLTEPRCSQVINSLREKKYISIEYQREGKQIKKRKMHVLHPAIRATRERQGDLFPAPTKHETSPKPDKPVNGELRKAVIDDIYKKYKALYGRNLEFDGKELKAVSEIIKKARGDIKHVIEKETILLSWIKDSNDKFRRSMTFLPSTINSQWNKLVDAPSQYKQI